MWNYRERNVYDMVMEDGLPCYLGRRPYHKYEPCDADGNNIRVGAFFAIDRKGPVLDKPVNPEFLLADVEQFERDHPELLPDPHEQQRIAAYSRHWGTPEDHAKITMFLVRWWDAAPAGKREHAVTAAQNEFPDVKESLVSRIAKVVDPRSPDDLIPAARTAKLLGKQPATLADWRSRGTVDLPFVKIGAAVFYQRGDVWEFLRKRKVRTGAEGRLINRRQPGSRSKRAADRGSTVSAAETASGTPKASPSDEGEGR